MLLERIDAIGSSVEKSKKDVENTITISAT